MFSKRIPTGEIAAGVNGRPRRYASRAARSTLSLARGRAIPFQPARVPALILPRKWSPLGAAAPAGTRALLAHPGLSRLRHPPPRDWWRRSRDWIARRELPPIASLQGSQPRSFLPSVPPQPEL